MTNGITTKWICIQENTYLTLYNNINGQLYYDSHKVGDIIEVGKYLMYFTDPKDNNLYVGTIRPDSNIYDGDFHNEPLLKEYFMPYTEWLVINREDQIRIVLDE